MYMFRFYNYLGSIKNISLVYIPRDLSDIFLIWFLSRDDIDYLSTSLVYCKGYADTIQLMPEHNRARQILRSLDL